ncbi:MAG: hypothetical protein CR972_00070 [Candidatus Moraniibacteriota bacterium]|nr:MAG: hypothetical protein CR972_00070 [Candidatus Moranbacteria bacterium]
MLEIHHIIIGFFIVMNMCAFLIMLWDKSVSRTKNVQRISEGLLFFLATVCGSIGVLVGMYFTRHKTRKWYFIVGIPLLIVENITLLFVIYLFVSGKIHWMM